MQFINNEIYFRGAQIHQQFDQLKANVPNIYASWFPDGNFPKRGGTAPSSQTFSQKIVQSNFRRSNKNMIQNVQTKKSIQDIYMPFPKNDIQQIQKIYKNSNKLLKREKIPPKKNKVNKFLKTRIQIEDFCKNNTLAKKHIELYSKIKKIEFSYNVLKSQKNKKNFSQQVFQKKPIEFQTQKDFRKKVEIKKEEKNENKQNLQTQLRKEQGHNPNINNSTEDIVLNDVLEYYEKEKEREIQVQNDPSQQKLNH